MLDLSCLNRPPPGPAESLIFADGFFIALAAMLVLALAGAALASPFVQRAYQRRILRLMRFNQVAPRPSQWWSTETGVGTRPVHLEDAGASTDRVADLLDLVSRQERRLAAGTMLAWLAFTVAALPVAVLVLADGSRSDQAFFVVGAAALALGPAFINLPQRFARPALIVGLLLCALAAVAAGLLAPDTVAEPPDADDSDALETAFGVAIVALAYLGIFHRRLRGLLFPMFVVAAVALMQIFIPYGYLEPHLGACIAELSEPGNVALSAPLYVVVSLLFGLAVWLGFKTLDGLAHLVEAGWLSELSLLGVASLSLIAIMLVAGVLSEQDAPSLWLALLPLPWMAIAVATYALTLSRSAPAGTGPRLLVLRVFTRRRKQQKLLDQLQSRWRYAGPVHQIGGPDLATANVDPHECALFLVGRLHDLFLPAAATPAQLESRLRARADREGRYGINEVFCFNSAWKQTVEQLMQISEAILLDLRGLTAQRLGTSYELRVLARTGLLDRVVALGDERTDWALAERLLAEEGQDPQRLSRRIVGAELRPEVIFERLLRVASETRDARERPRSSGP
jgi:hypothetical protein